MELTDLAVLDISIAPQYPSLMRLKWILVTLAIALPLSGAAELRDPAQQPRRSEHRQKMKSQKWKFTLSSKYADMGDRAEGTATGSFDPSKKTLTLSIDGLALKPDRPLQAHQLFIKMGNQVTLKQSQPDLGSSGWTVDHSERLNGSCLLEVEGTPEPSKVTLTYNFGGIDPEAGGHSHEAYVFILQ